MWKTLSEEALTPTSKNISKAIQVKITEYQEGNAYYISLNHISSQKIIIVDANFTNNLVHSFLEKLYYVCGHLKFHSED